MVVYIQCTGDQNAPAVGHVDRVPVEHAHEDRQALLELLRQQDLLGEEGARCDLVITEARYTSSMLFVYILHNNNHATWPQHSIFLSYT